MEDKERFIYENKLIKCMDTSILEELGLTNAEIKIYLALLELGTSTAGPIIEKTGLQNSVVHMTLHKLVQKGFISYVKKGKIKHYEATDPENILKFIDEKKERFKAILPELISKQQYVEKQEAEIFEGFKGFKNMQYEFIEDAKPGDEYLFFAFYTEKPEDYAYVYNFYAEFDKERDRRGIITKGIAPTRIKKLIHKRQIPKIIFVDFPTPSNVSIFRDKVVLTPWEDKPISFLIRSRYLAASFRRFFYSVWDQYQKKQKKK